MFLTLYLLSSKFRINFFIYFKYIWVKYNLYLHLKLVSLYKGISLNIVKELTKFRLTISVVFSSFISYFLGAEVIDYGKVSLLLIGGILIVGSSNIFNQIIEKDLDMLMARTKNRPLPKKEISQSLALFIAIICSLFGIFLMYLINLKVAILASISLFLYAAVYLSLIHI